MVKEVEELIKIVDEGNLLEALFIRWGSFQHADLERDIDHRNHLGLSSFIEKTKEPLDKYFNLMFSLQGLFLIYTQAYKILAENGQLNAQGVIDETYAAVSNDKLRQEFNGIINHEELTEGEKKFTLLNILANPKGETLFNNNDDFEKQVLNNIKELLKINYTNKFDREFDLCKEVINHYYAIHNIKTDKDIALLFSSYGIFSVHRDHQDILLLNQYIDEKAQKINTPLYLDYVKKLVQTLQNIKIPSENGFTTYMLDNKGIDDLNTSFNMLAIVEKEDNQDFLCPKNIKSTLKKLLKNQSSDAFEKEVTNPKNIYYSAPQIANGYVPNFSTKKEGKNKEYKNTACWVILGAFVLSLGICIVDYFLMEQKLLQPVKDILPQDNPINLVIAALVTIIIVYAVFQLLKPQQEPPLSMVSGIGDVANGSGYTR